MGSRTKTVPSKEPVPVNTRFQMSEVRDVVSKDDGECWEDFPLRLSLSSLLSLLDHLVDSANLLSITTRSVTTPF
jgi:hypothetical protein